MPADLLSLERENESAAFQGEELVLIPMPVHWRDREIGMVRSAAFVGRVDGGDFVDGFRAGGTGPADDVR